MPISEKVRAEHLRDVTIHELCHAFTVLPRCTVLILKLGINRLYDILPNQKAWDGRVTVHVLDNELYQDSVYGWAGIVGEAIERDRAKAVELALARYKNGRQTVSKTDLDQIECVAPEVRTKTIQAAYEVLLAKWTEIKDLQHRTIKLIEGRQLDSLEFGWSKDTGWLGPE